MNIQLFNPPVRHYQGVGYAMNPPLGLPILAAVLRAAGHTAECVDLEFLGVSPAALAARYAGDRDAWPDWVGFTSLTSSARGVRESIAALRGVGYTGQVVVGGVHATIEPEEVLGYGADLVITGECEGNLVSLLESGARGIHEGVACPIEAVPAPDWLHHTPKPDAYIGNAPHLSMPEAITMWTRGCPYECVFCGNAIFSPTRKRCRPVANVVAELEQIKDYGTRSLFVYDDELLGVRLPDGWLHELCEAIAPLGFTWKTQGRCSQKWITEQVLADIHHAGCKVVMWGCESFSDKVLSTLGKGTTVADNWHTLRTAKAAGLKNFVFSMIGNAEETDAELQETCNALAQAYREGLVDYRQTTIVTALPHTRLWRRQKAEGWYEAIPESGRQMAQVYRDTPWLTGERMAYWLQRFSEACPVNIEGPMR